MNPLQLPILTANRFQGGCPNCGYGTSLQGRCSYCLVSNVSEEEQGFHQAMSAEPHNPVHHMIYADWLDEHNQPKESHYHRNIAEGMTHPQYHALITNHPHDTVIHAEVRHRLGRGSLTPIYALSRLVSSNPNSIPHRRIYADIMESSSTTDQRNEIENQRRYIRALEGGARFVTRDVVPGLDYGQELYHVEERNRNGTAARVRVNGRLKTWKTRPEDFRLPTKYGFYGHGIDITPSNQHEWMTHDITQY